MKVSPRYLVILLVLAALVVGTTVMCSARNSGSGTHVEHEQRDCDLGDRLEGDSDCGTAPSSKTKTSKPRSSSRGLSR